MSDILVLSFAYTTDGSKWRALRDSCMKHRVPLHVMGINRQHPGPCGFEEATEFLKSRSEEYIVITDSFDVICNRWDEDQLRMLIDSAPNLIMSVEPLVWPVGAPDSYPSRDRYKWRAINGGQYCGRREQVIDMWGSMMAHWAAGAAKLGGGSQEILHQFQKDGWAFTLDLECRIFQSMIEPQARYIIKALRAPMATDPAWVARNSHTKSYPMFLHFNGQGSNLSPTFDEWKRLLL